MARDIEVIELVKKLSGAGGCGRPRPHSVAEGGTVIGFAGWNHDKFLRKILWQFT